MNKTITYLRLIIEHVSDDKIGKLIAAIYGVDNFYNPFDTNKDLLLNILLYKDFNFGFKKYTKGDVLVAKRKCAVEIIGDINLKKNIDYRKPFPGAKMELLSDAEKMPDKLNLLLKKFDNEFVQNNIYLQLLIAFKDKYHNKFKYKDKEFEYSKYIRGLDDMLEVWNSIFAPFDKDEHALFTKSLNDIILSIISFEVIIPQIELKKFINVAVDEILKYDTYYTIENNFVYYKFIKQTKNIDFSKNMINKRRLIDIGNALYLYDEDTNRKQKFKHKTSIRKKNTHSLLNTRSVNGFIQSYDSLHTAWKELDSKIFLSNYKKNSENRYCHICNPPKNIDERNSKSSMFKVHKCNNCKEIFNRISEIAPQYTYNKIRDAVKLKAEKERSLPAEELKEKHYDRLKKLLRSVTNSGSADDLYELVERTFGKET